MQIRFYLLVFLFSLAFNSYGLETNIENNKQRLPQPEQPKVKKSKQAVTKINKTGNGKPFIPSDKVSPDVPVSFPADI